MGRILLLRELFYRSQTLSFSATSGIFKPLTTDFPMAKVQKETTFLVSSAGTGFFYTSRRNKKKLRGGAESKLKLKKYDPVAKQHVLFEEKKLSALKKKFDPSSLAAPAGAADESSDSEALGASSGSTPAGYR